ncbi:MAG: RsmB/NOP family class I SAM-dependent RNA methyltransferase [Alphaproteobacteria bacterium]|nr:MAG: RsmB/NOP family class I SAM-dependent RNA methyltransferase [Alphaproteobacteria bacterium]
MTPGARLAAATEILGAIEAAWRSGGAAADSIVEGYFRKRRYAGSHDRRWIIAEVYAALRERGLRLWRLAAEGLEATAERQVLLGLLCAGDIDPAWFGGPHSLPSPSGEELAALRRAAQREGAPPAARHNVPDWLFDRLATRFGAALEREMAALAARAPLDLRVNTARIGRRRVLEQLADSGLKAQPTPWSPLGIRIEESRNIKGHALFQKGLVELQDESSQLATLLCGVRPGEQVADLCAGAGGKTLALSALMQGRGQIFAFDTDRRRLSALRTRARRADVRNLQAHPLAADADLRMAQLEAHRGHFDLVVVDAPCSGSGTWRRNPDLRWRFAPDDLARIAARQRALVAEAMTLARPQGRVAYMTCSLLTEENEAVVEEALANHAGWRLVDFREAWAETIGGEAPESAAGPPATLQLTPARHGCDGFFFALMARG